MNMQTGDLTFDRHVTASARRRNDDKNNIVSPTMWMKLCTSVKAQTSRTAAASSLLCAPCAFHGCAFSLCNYQGYQVSSIITLPFEKILKTWIDTPPSSSYPFGKNKGVAYKCGMGTSQLCPICKTPETTQHLSDVCVQFDRNRNNLMWALNSVGVQGPGTTHRRRTMKKVLPAIFKATELDKRI